MIYDKPALTYTQQAAQLIERGLHGDPLVLKQTLQKVNYYRLSGYWFPFRDYPYETFKTGTNFETIWRRYTFDRHLRLLVLDGIERIEVAIRSEITYELAHRYGPFGYKEHDNLPQLTVDEHLVINMELPIL